MADRKEILKELIEKYQSFKEQGRLDLSSEETMRTWINEFLAIFNWDVRDTSQILQEKVLSKAEKERLAEIGSTSTRPDYTFKRGKDKLTFLDAKGIYIDLETDSEAAFQIKSYGWSILAPCAFITNFEEFVIYDCTYIPSQEQPVSFGRIYLKIDDYLDNFEILENHLLKSYILNGKLSLIYSDTLEGERGIQKLSPDFLFAQQLSEFRLALATQILTSNKPTINDNSEMLAYITQVVINRIIFIRICEARKIEKEGLLIEFQKNGFWNSFKESSYNDFYEHYDGPLFDRINNIHEIEIPDEVFNSLIELLYYPSPYRFDVIPTKLLSDIYEIFLSKRLFIENDTVEEKLKLEYIKTNGAVSTPQYLVQDLLKRTIVKQNITNEGIRSVFNSKVLDFACGSGIFLIELFDHLQNIIIENYSLNPEAEFAHLFFANDNTTTLTIEGKRKLISDCIYAVDIDPEAVEVARMSLSLKVIDTIEFHENYQELGIYGNQILNNVGNNVKCGNTLVAFDITEKYPRINQNEEQLIKTNPFDWNSEAGFHEIFNVNGGFDFIIGNPPYVEVKNYNVEYPFMHQYIKDYYQTTKNGKVDLSVAFIERGIELLNENGKLGVIVQKRFFKTEYGKKIREYISSNQLLYQVIDFDTTNLFKGRITYISSLILDKSHPEMVSFAKILNEPEEIPARLNYIPLLEVNDSYFTMIPFNAFNSNPWNFEDADLLSIKTNLLNRHGNFGAYAKVRVGIQVLWDRAYHLTVKEFYDNGTMLCDSHLEEDFIIEIPACRPLLVNERFYPFCSDATDTYVIFPYDVTENENTPISFSDYSDRYPLAGEYLARNKTVIVENVETWQDEELWHQFTRVQNHKAIYPRVLIPMTANDTIASITTNPLNYCDNANMFFIDIPEKNEINLFAIASIINSTLFSVCARSIANPQQNGYFKFNKQFIEPIPFPKGNYENNIALVEEISGIGRNIEQVQNQYLTATPRQKNIHGNSLNNLWNSLDEKVYELYQLSDEEKNFFRGRGRNINRIQILD
jgi:Type I restriction-modification system methyltransferase subunit